MSLILIADTPQPGRISSLQRILYGHDLVLVESLSNAKEQLQNIAFDLIIVTLHFDASQMFELMREIRNFPKNCEAPIICVCAKETKMASLMHQSLDLTTRALGAWMYISEHAYNVLQSPDAELRRVIERCLTESFRKVIQQRRVDIQEERTRIQLLRSQLIELTETGAVERSGILLELRKQLDLLQSSAQQLKLTADFQRAVVESSRLLSDRVSDSVIISENEMTDLEDVQLKRETSQTTAEADFSDAESHKHCIGQN